MFEVFWQLQLLSILQFILILVIGFLVSSLVSDILNKTLRREDFLKFLDELGYDEPVIDLIIVVVKYLIYFIAFVIALAQFGFGTWIFNLLIFMIIAFFVIFVIYSLKDFLPNAAAGIYLVRVKMIKAGDKISFGGYKGTIKKISLFTTTLEDEEGRILIVPNANLTKKEIIVERG